jgi:hypothetical protein|tara:strand:+ start:765 stop:1184 length:420 start_codon:yes stop_codon:yes gene_type:complete
MRKLIYETLDAVSKASKKADKIEILRGNDSWALKDVLRATYDESIQFWLPPGEVPYTPNREGSIPSNLLKLNTKFKYFCKGGPADRMLGSKRESIFIDLLESIHPKDAVVCTKMINKESLGKGITKKLVQEAFPGLILR